MGALQRVIAQVLARLRDINTSQRIALLLGGALIAVSLLWLVQWAARPELVPLLEQDLQPDEIAQVRSGLDLVGEPYEVRGNRIYVRAASHRQTLIAQLQQQEKLPANTSTAFANLIKESDPWISMEESNRRWTLALQQALEQVLRQFNGVRSANVFLNLNAQAKSFTRNPPPSSASVTLTLKHGAEVSHTLALAAARLVSGAVAGLPVHNVEVVDATTGRVALDWESEQDVATLLERRLAKEELRYAQKIRQQIPDPKALVSVQVELNSTTRNTQTDQPLKGVAKSERTERMDSVRGRPSEMPGVQPNVGLAAGGGGTAETQQQETSETENEVGRAKKVEATPPGDVEKVTAAISLSHSYLESVLRRASPGASAPTDTEIEEVYQRERTRLLTQVVQLVKPQTEENVAISRYYDTPADLAPSGSPARLDEAYDLAKRYGPQSALGLLALISLAMMLRMARRSDAAESFGLELGLPKEAIEAARAAALDVATMAARSGRSALGRAPGAAGGPRTSVPLGSGMDADVAPTIENAPVTEGMLVAQEVDASTVQTRKMLEQVSSMVDADAETVTSLIEQWVQRNEQYRDEMT